MEHFDNNYYPYSPPGVEIIDHVLDSIICDSLTDGSNEDLIYEDWS